MKLLPHFYYSPNTKNSKSDYLKGGVLLHGTATGSIVKVHVIITVHVEQNLSVMLQGSGR